MENIITRETKEILTEILLDKAKRIAEDVLKKLVRKIWKGININTQWYNLAVKFIPFGHIMDAST